MKSQRKKQGGKRKGAGRKPAPYKTKVMSFRVKEEHYDVLKQAIKKAIKLMQE